MNLVHKDGKNLQEELVSYDLLNQDAGVGFIELDVQVKGDEETHFICWETSLVGSSQPECS